MRNITPELCKKIASGESFIYCFEINSINTTSLYLTSSSIALNIRDQIFLPNSGIHIVSGEFNDSGYDHVILEGVFEQGGITHEIDLTSSIVTIILYFVDQAQNADASQSCYYHWLTYNCNLYTKYDLSFALYLEPNTKKYEQSLLRKFSKSCRADFGDHRCMLNKFTYASHYYISEIIGSSLTVLDLDKANGYFDGGDLIFDKTQFIVKVLKQTDNVLEINQQIPDLLKDHKNIILIPGCDKKFITCCNKFDNAINFRGEPWIPEDNFLNIN